MSPHDFYEMRIEDFLLKSNGFRSARAREERAIRNLAEIAAAPYRKEGSPSIMSMWHIYGDEEIKEAQAKDREARTKKLMNRKPDLMAKKLEWLKKAAESRDTNINPQFN